MNKNIEHYRSFGVFGRSRLFSGRFSVCGERSVTRNLIAASVNWRPNVYSDKFDPSRYTFRGWASSFFAEILLGKGATENHYSSKRKIIWVAQCP